MLKDEQVVGIDTNDKAKILVRMVPMFITMGTIFFLSSQTVDQVELPKIPHFDLFCHFCIYAVLALTTLYVPTKKVRETRFGITFTATLLFCFLYGVSDEYHQSFVPGRDASITDLAADLCGIVFVLMVWRNIYYKRKVLVRN